MDDRIPANLFQGLGIARIAADNPITFVDLGSRGGFQDDLTAIAFAVDAIGFEPDPKAHAELTRRPDGPWRSERFLPLAVSPLGGMRTLTVPTHPESATLLTPNPLIGERFEHPFYFDTKETITVETQTLDAALAAAETDRIDFLKIDIEGAELDVLEAAPEAVETLLAAKVEVGFLPLRHSQKLAHDVAAFFHARDFELMAMIGPAHWRRAGTVIHPYPSPDDPPYSKGQLIQCDYLFFKAPNRVVEDRDSAVRMALIAMAMGYFDHALGLLEHDAVAPHLKAAYGLEPATVVRKASRLYGRHVFRRAAMRHLRGLAPFVRYFPNLFR